MTSRIYIFDYYIVYIHLHIFEAIFLLNMFQCTPPPGGLGSCSAVYTTEIGDAEVVCFRQDSETGKVATIIVRGSSDNLMDDIERAVDDGVNTVKALTKVTWLSFLCALCNSRIMSVLNEVA